MSRRQAEVEIVDAGLGVSLQDRGRLGWRRLGVPLSGALDPALLAIANALAGNRGDDGNGEAALEVLAVGPTLKVHSGRVRLALAGPIAGTLQRGADDGAPRAVAGWSTVTLGAGDSLRLGAIGAVAGAGASPLSIAYIAASGGFGGVEVLSSRSTYARAALGFVPAAGGRLPCRCVPDQALPERRGAAPFQHVDGPIRALPGPQADHFTEAALETFFSASFSVTSSSDRMGMRLSGPRLAHSALGAEIASDGVTPGAVQVPADGQPIVLMADGQTVGGYPKIATVIRADLPRLAHLRPGASLRFARATLAEADAARAQLAARIAHWIGAIEAFQPGGIDDAALYAQNLVSGMVRGDGDG